MSLDFVDDISAQEVEQAVSTMTFSIKQAFPIVKRVFIEAESRAGHLQSSL
jgi:hypothetical protein